MNTTVQHLIAIKLLNIDDAIQLYALIDESRSGLTNLTWSKNSTLETTLDFLKYKIEIKDKVYGVFYENKLAAVLELRKKDDMLELGYWVGTQYRGKGIMKVAVKNLVDNEVKSNTITAHIREGNKASYQILQYAGLTYDHTEVWQGENWLHLKRIKE
jgi:RimJ/RimL family protein N-acetyltransferase